MMNLKEAFHYQNFLTNLCEEMTTYCYLGNNFTTSVTFHKKKSANPEAEDETLEEEVNGKYDIPVDTVIGFYASLAEEKRKLSCAIAETKMKNENVDLLLEENKSIRTIISGMERIMRIKPETKRLTKGSAQKFNINGEAVAYTYDIETTTRADFDRNKLKEIFSSLKAKAEENSKKVDVINVTSEVNYNPPYEIDATIEDCICLYAERCDK